MGIIRWLQRRALRPGDSAVTCTRKKLMAPACCLAGVFGTFWTLRNLMLCLDDAAATHDWLNFIATSLFSAALLPAGIYIVTTGKMTRRLCEVPVMMCVPAIIIFDCSMLMQDKQSAVSMVVVVLDCLLLCDCTDVVTNGIVAVTTLWLAVSSVLRADRRDEQGVTFVFSILSIFSAAAVVLIADFHFTRGFAKSMYEQQAMVQASVEMTEVAAVRLARYETAETLALLDGPGAAGLPDGLRAALLRLVANLAEYRPYLPQSCLPQADGGEEEGEPAEGVSAEATEPDREPTSAEDVHSCAQSCASPRSLVLGSSQCSSQEPLKSRVATNAKTRRASFVAVNSKSLLSMIDGCPTHTVQSFIRAEVESFASAVASERGLVDVVSGDHMFGNFNTSRMCTTHRASAARVVWGMTSGGTTTVSSADTSSAFRTESLALIRYTKRTGCACSGTVLAGDFGTSDLRRFMMLGPAVNTLHSLERVAAQHGTVLADEAVCSDADVGSQFFLVLVERLVYAKRGPKPFLVWHVAGRRDLAGGPEEWMYELERQEPNPHEDWNRQLREWLNFGDSPSDSSLQLGPLAAALTAARQQSHLVDASVVGETVAVQAALSYEVARTVR